MLIFVYLLSFPLFNFTTAILVRPTVALGHGVHLSLVPRQRAAGSGRWRVFRRVCLLFGACSLRIDQKKNAHVSTNSLLFFQEWRETTDRRTKSQSVRPSHTQHWFLGNWWRKKGHGYKTRPWKHHLQSYDTSRSYRSNHRVILSLSPHGNATDPQGLGEKQYWNSGLKNTMCASRPGVALAESEKRERGRQMRF